MCSKYILLILITVGLLTSATAQISLSPSVNPTQGGNAVAGSVDLSWTMGETFAPTLTVGSVMLSQGFEQPEVEILTGTITGGSFCTGGPVSIPFTSAGIISTSNVFTAQLSNSTGSFASPVNIGTLAGNTISGTISGTIPPGTAAGTQYRIRVVASEPNYVGKDNGANLSVIVCPASTYTWTGATNTSWHVASNWSPAGIPNSCSDNVIINNTTNKPIVSTPVSVGDLELKSGALLTLNADLSVCGNWKGGTTLSTVTGSSIVTMQGGTTHIITNKTNFNELRLNNTSGGVTMSGATVNINTALDLQRGTFDATGGTLTFKSSSPSSIAIIDNFSSGYTGTLTGSVKIERAYSASQTFSEHFMGSPVDAPLFSQFGSSGTAGFIVPTANCDETRVATGSPYGNVLSYHETNGSVCSSAQWKNEAGTDHAVNGQGYSVAKPGSGVLTVTGNANLNTSYTVSTLTNTGYSTTVTLQGRPVGPGWHLLSNPYDAPIFLPANNGAFNPGFTNEVMVWIADNASLYTGTYQPLTAGVDAYIAPFQAFMVHVQNPTGGSPKSFTILGSSRVRTSPATFHNQSAEQLTINVSNNTNGLLDKTTVGFRSDATEQFDREFDLHKPAGGLTRQTIYTYTNNTLDWMSNNNFHSISETGTVNVGFEPGATAAFTLNFEGVNSFDPSSYIFLEDKKLNLMYNVRNGDYNFTADSADDWHRFVLHFTPPVEINAQDATCTAAGNINIAQPGTAQWNYVITDANNTQIASGTLDVYHPQNVSAVMGDYTLTLSDNTGYTVTKPIHMSGAQVLDASFTVSNNSIHERENVVMNATTADAASYEWNLGNGVTSSGQSVTLNYLAAGTYNVVLTVTSRSGCVSSSTQTITVNEDATGLNDVTANHGIGIWSAESLVYVDFTRLQNVEATINIYNLLGQEISSEKFTNNSVYRKEIDNIEAAYMLVQVKNGDKVTTKKVFIVNAR